MHQEGQALSSTGLSDAVAAPAYASADMPNDIDPALAASSAQRTQFMPDLPLDTLFAGNLTSPMLNDLLLQIAQSEPIANGI